jgi:rare lipoprotein A
VIPSRRGLAASCLAALSLGGCFSAPPRTEEPAPPAAVPEIAPPPAADTIPDAVPRVEPRSKSGNPPFYEVFGKRYYVLSTNVGYIERGVASWYGPGFHQVRTSTGEIYNMYAMTAAHKTLPLPAYVRVTNLQNGRSVVVRVNDRGPFVGNRIIDLSYTAASKLDMLRNGTAFVEVRSLDASDTQAVTMTASNTLPPPLPATESQAPVAEGAATPANTPAVGAPLYIQAGAFSDPNNAKRLVEKLSSADYGKIFVRDDEIAGRRMYRVRIGPVPNVAEFDRIVAALERSGIRDAHLALE